MLTQGRKRFGRVTVIGIAGATTVALISVSAAALLAGLTTIPLGRGTATITWTGATGDTPTIKSITGVVDRYQVSATGKIPKPATSKPPVYPIADIKGTIGGSPFTLDIVLGPFTSGTSTKTDLVGHVVGTFRTQAVTGILTSRVNTDVIGFSGKIGALHLTGAISKLSQHGDAETAHASYDITK